MKNIIISSSNNATLELNVEDTLTVSQLIRDSRVFGFFRKSPDFVLKHLVIVGEIDIETNEDLEYALRGIVEDGMFLKFDIPGFTVGATQAAATAAEDIDEDDEDDDDEDMHTTRVNTGDGFVTVVGTSNTEVMVRITPGMTVKSAALSETVRNQLNESVERLQACGIAVKSIEITWQQAEERPAVNGDRITLTPPCGNIKGDN